MIVLLCVDRFTFKSVYKRGISSLHFSRGPDFRGVGDVEPNVTKYAAPARAGPDKLRGLPPTFVDVGGLDLFRQDITKFVAALATAGVDVEFHHYSGLPHGVEMMAPGISKAIAMNKNTCRFICRF
ncbi:uncharacterized protein PpBr36_11436 [Pyricularia pennisetigena]|uniref:uncharacterized protein n=1 Tax=Pyricularia pennisetigena TaxID=1578925 RepID=UPI0011543377|nr:uncharacterized protein PpBr36_11436 [Pyricularia pennisetigena]TLS20300.1 hypothetical protein PpBr36_11436 [Pyricularia pennisetigena]